MDHYIMLQNEYFEIIISHTLKDYGEKVLQYSSNKIKEYLNFFKEKEYGQKIKCYFFTNRTDFINRIKAISPHNTPLPPLWATGCFYGGEVQILLNEENINDRFYTLAHETFHLLFDQFVYQKNNFDRIIWLDESLAGNFDGRVENLIKQNKFSKLIKKLIDIKTLPIMNELSFQNEDTETNKYSEYDLFKVVGRYLMETKTMDELLTYIGQEEKILLDGTTILETSLSYFKEKYNL